jgi:hypothetical protein
MICSQMNLDWGLIVGSQGAIGIGISRSLYS